MSIEISSCVIYYYVTACPVYVLYKSNILIYIFIYLCCLIKWYSIDWIILNSGPVNILFLHFSNGFLFQLCNSIFKGRVTKHTFHLTAQL